MPLFCQRLGLGILLSGLLIGVEGQAQTVSPESLQHLRSSSDLILTQTPTPQESAPSLRTQPQDADSPPFRPKQVPLRPGRQQITPSITLLTPSAYSAPLGDVGIGIGFQERTRFVNDTDGAIGIGIGLGDAGRAVGIDVGITSTSTLRRGVFQAGTVSLKVNRDLPEDVSVAVGVQNFIVWGDYPTSSSVYGVVTKAFRLEEETTQPFSAIYLSLGVGGGNFRSIPDVNQGLYSVGVFGSIAVRVLEPVNVIAEWSGQDWTIGTSVVPFAGVPLVITPAVTDLANNAGVGARFIFSIGYGFRF
ncbi:MAG: hypothetical protein SFW36_19935 [Leptolyngbyaceae cyanobacterium bins.59]|nr:hypothetical protein [Leptolyngbyaceae cyanobacterium bins.59]